MFALVLFLEGLIGSLFSGMVGPFLLDILRCLFNNPLQILHTKYIYFVFYKVAIVFVSGMILLFVYLMFRHFGKISRYTSVRRAFNRVDNKTAVFGAVSSRYNFTFVKKDTRLTA